MGNIRFLSLSLVLYILCLLAGCATNPVTGRSELMLISESYEIQMGQENYLPARQMQGGDYVADKSVEAYVNKVGQKLAAVSDRPLPYEFKVVNSPQVNAWMMPGGKMGINRGLLLKMDNEAELAAVIGHEITHAAAKHGAKQMQESLLLQGGVLAASALLHNSVKDDRLQGVGVIGAQTAAKLITSKFSRDDERQADHYGMVYMARAGYDPKAAVSVQELLLEESKGKRENLFSQLLADHPPSAERVALNRSFTEELPAGGILGRQEYRRSLEHLFKTAPAYAFYDKAGKALKNGDYKKARSLTDKAIAGEPKEALFYIMRGKAMEAMKLPGAAVQEYRHAARLNPEYYEGYLRLGLLLDSQGKGGEARTALEKSIHLLKTDVALYKLGRYALHDGDTRLAKGYFREAMVSGKSAGRAAYADLLQLDLPENAANYLGSGLTVSDAGKLIIIIQNNTPFPVKNTVVILKTSQGRKQIKINNIIGPKSRSAFQTNEAAVSRELGKFGVAVLSSRLAM